jgi:hypothetical protein
LVALLGAFKSEGGGDADADDDAAVPTTTIASLSARQF